MLRELADVLTRPTISEKLCTSRDFLGDSREKVREITQGDYRLGSLTLVHGKVMKLSPLGKHFRVYEDDDDWG